MTETIVLTILGSVKRNLRHCRSALSAALSSSVFYRFNTTVA